MGSHKKIKRPIHTYVCQYKKCYCQVSKTFNHDSNNWIWIRGAGAKDLSAIEP